MFYILYRSIQSFYRLLQWFFFDYFTFYLCHNSPLMNFTNSIVTDYSLAKDVTGDRVEVIENSGKDIRFEQNNLQYAYLEIYSNDIKIGVCHVTHPYAY